MSVIIDISVPIRGAMPIYPGDQPFELEPMLRIEQGAVCNLSRVRMGTHTGTHIDAPWHFKAEGKRVHQIPLARLIGPVWVADLCGLPAVTALALKQAQIPPAFTRLLIKTDNSALWRFSTFQQGYVSLTPDACDWLIENCIDVVGLDYLSVEPFGAPKPEVHHKLCGAGVIIIEGLNLLEVETGTYELLCMPLCIEGADGAPARVALRTP